MLFVVEQPSIRHPNKSSDYEKTNKGKNQKINRKVQKESVKAIQSPSFSVKTISIILYRVLWANGNYQYKDNVIRFQKEIKLWKNIQKLKYMRTRRIEVIKPIIEVKTANQTWFWLQ